MRLNGRQARIIGAKEDSNEKRWSGGFSLDIVDDMDLEVFAQPTRCRPSDIQRRPLRR